ncbi:MAG: hypothetical protein LC804_27265 [Acidobacteria bacterium]|nr:hypothetical protein [Acidobacteriota bacterium]
MIRDTTPGWTFHAYANSRTIEGDTRSSSVGMSRSVRSTIGDAFGQLAIGISGAGRNAAVAACHHGKLIAFCEQERITRVKGARLEPGGLPHGALNTVLKLTGGQASAVERYAVAEESVRLPDDLPVVRVDHHCAHAATAFYTSRFDEAAVIVCDEHSTPSLSVWAGTAAGLKQWPWDVASAQFASIYTACGKIFGFQPGQEHQLEALARLGNGTQGSRFEGLIGYSDGRLFASPGWEQTVSEWLSESSGENLRHRAALASGFQRHIGSLLLKLATEVRATVGSRHLCLSGGLFFNTYFNTVISRAGVFDDVFVAPNPGNAGLAAGAALLASLPRSDGPPCVASPFLGPEYDLEEIKQTLDNCKLSYECLHEGELIDATAEALRRGQLVGWFQGRMEWAHKALGNRSILANPLSPYVLENLNVFLKHRTRHRAYGLSVPEDDVPTMLVGPPASRFMEFDYEVRDVERLRNVLPEGAVTLRVQTIPTSDDASRRFRLLHKVFGEATGLPALVNTSFNGFLEPIVCSPRDAVRVFYGTGLDMLVLDRFILRK